MTTPRKPAGRAPGKTPADITRLKEFWRDPLAKIDRAYWRGRFWSRATQAQIRTELLTATGIQLQSDARLTDFRQWLEAMDASAQEDFSI